MSKISLPAITNGQDLTTLNNNFASIATALNSGALYRTNPSGEPNTMSQALDMNGNAIINVSDVTINGISIGAEATVAQAAATQAAASAVLSGTKADASQGSATASSVSATASAASAVTAANAASASGSLIAVNNLSDLVNVTTAKTNLSLQNVTNTSDANKPVSTAQATALALKAPLASPTFTGTVGGVTATMVGLGNVTNTSDASKPVSTAQATAIALKLNHAGDVTGGNAAAGDIGEYITATASGTSVSSGTAINATSISLTAGDWDVSGVAQWNPAGTTVIGSEFVSLNTVSATLGGIGFGASNQCTHGAGAGDAIPTPVLRLSLAATTTVFLVVNQFFSTSTCTVSSLIRARRVR